MNNIIATALKAKVAHADEMLAAKKYDLAIASYSRAIFLDPNNPLLY
jgi:hypothetical protein